MNNYASAYTRGSLYPTPPGRSFPSSLPHHAFMFFNSPQPSAILISINFFFFLSSYEFPWALICMMTTSFSFVFCLRRNEWDESIEGEEKKATKIAGEFRLIDKNSNLRKKHCRKNLEIDFRGNFLKFFFCISIPRQFFDVSCLRATSHRGTWHSSKHH